ncbi:MAG: hypothetical protein ABIB97_04605 [Patescibacteria group bacterium]
MKKYFWFALVIGFLLLISAVSVQAITEADCGPGYTWDRMSGVGCKQTNCNDIGDAHYSYTGHCICGSSGSINEDPTDPNKECYKGSDNEGCSGCLYACVGLDEDCPGDTGTTTNTNSSNNTNTSVSTNPNTNQATNTNANQNTNTNSNQNVNISQAGTNISLNTGGTATGPTCESHCNKYLRGHKNAVLTSFSGTFPACKCQIDIKDDLNRLTNTISVDGDNDTTYTFDQNGNLTKKVKVNRKEETEKIRIRLGYKYTQEEIDKILDPDKIEEWFLNQIKNIKTETSKLHPQYWWQHLVAIFDHGFNGNSADFVDTYQFGRCGDSMQWLERDLLNKLDINKDPAKPGQKHEGLLSITGESYSNLLNHTSIMIRPPGIGNLEWDDMVKALKKLSGGSKSNPGIPPNQLKNVDPRLLDAKVLDPYKKEVTTVREFIKGWSYLRIS